MFLQDNNLLIYKDYDELSKEEQQQTRIKLYEFLRKDKEDKIFKSEQEILNYLISNNCKNVKLAFRQYDLQPTFKIIKDNVQILLTFKYEYSNGYILKSID